MRLVSVSVSVSGDGFGGAGGAGGAVRAVQVGRSEAGGVEQVEGERGGWCRSGWGGPVGARQLGKIRLKGAMRAVLDWWCISGWGGRPRLGGDTGEGGSGAVRKGGGLFAVTTKGRCFACLSPGSAFGMGWAGVCHAGVSDQ